MDVHEVKQYFLLVCSDLDQARTINKRYCTYSTVRENKSHVTLSKEAITNRVRGVDNAGKSIVVDDGIHRG